MEDIIYNNYTLKTAEEMFLRKNSYGNQYSQGMRKENEIHLQKITNYTLHSLILLQVAIHSDVNVQMCVSVCLYVEPVSISTDCVRSGINIDSVVCLYTPVLLSVPEMEGIYATGGILF